MAAAEVVDVEDVIEAVEGSVVAPMVDSMVVSAREVEAAIKATIPQELTLNLMIRVGLVSNVTTVARKVISRETVRRIQTQEIRDHAKQHSRVFKIGSLSI
jgi:hypothetical protein